MSTQAGTLPNKTETVTPAASKEGHVKLSWREKICYGFGDFGNGFMFDLGQAYLTKYWIDAAPFRPLPLQVSSPLRKSSMLSWILSPVPSSTAVRISARAASSARL